MANIIPDDRWVVEDDGLFCQEVGPWAETKHNLVSYYGRLFSTGMKDKWDSRIYIELYAGAGYSRIRETLRIDRKSTRLNSSHDQISYAVFCLKKKRKHN